MEKIGFAGAGRMASAMVHSLLGKGGLNPSSLLCTSADDGTGPALAESTGIGFKSTLLELVDSVDVIVLAIKPQQLHDLDAAVGALGKGRLVLSILAGTPLSKLGMKFPHARAIVRAMPNTPGQIGAGVTAFASDDNLTPKDREIVDTVLGSLGAVYEVEESQLDAVTGLSGSGPAYVFEFIAALRDGGVDAGLSREIASALAIHTVLGAARLVAETHEEPETLRDRVTSPGGTTLAGLQAMEKGQFRVLMKNTVQAACERSRELARG